MNLLIRVREHLSNRTVAAFIYSPDLEGARDGMTETITLPAVSDARRVMTYAIDVIPISAYTMDELREWSTRAR